MVFGQFFTKYEGRNYHGHQSTLEIVKQVGFYFQNEVGKLWLYASESLIIDSKLFFDKLLETFPCIV